MLWLTPLEVMDWALLTLEQEEACWSTGIRFMEELLGYLVDQL